jgi:hypothetical protein
MTEALSVLPQGIPASRPKKMSRKEDQVLQGLCQIVVHGVRRPLMPRGDAVGLLPSWEETYLQQALHGASRSW